MQYTYREALVFIPPRAEVSNAFRPEGKFGELIQRVLDAIEPWDVGDDPIETFTLPRKIGARVIALAAGEAPLWGINVHHTARHPGLSPFVMPRLNDDRFATDLATLELRGPVTEPVLTRIYPGDYMPPLPWMASARNADGGVAACISYWQSHAYVMRDDNRMQDLTNAAPDWYYQNSDTTAR
jgi:hypothetical protein